MCCQSCERFETCHSAITLRIHEPAAHGMPPNHYHLCRTRAACEYRCQSCEDRVGMWGSVPRTIFNYGCCNRCSEYKTCKDFVEKHLKEAAMLAEVSKAKENGWRRAAAIEMRAQHRRAVTSR